MEKGIIRFGICFNFASVDDFAHLLPTTTNNNISLVNMTITHQQQVALVNTRTLIINTIFMVTMTLLVTIPNLALIVGIVKTSKPKITLSKALYIYVSITDLSYAVLTNPYFLILNFTGKDCTNQSIGMGFSMFTVGLGVSTFVLISILRNQKVRKPMHPVRLCLVWSYLIGYLAIFVTYGVFTFWVFGPWFTSFSLLASYWFILFVFFLSQTLLMILYNGWTRMSLQNNYVRKQDTTKSNLSEDDRANTMLERRNRRAVATLIWISVVYIACILPIAIYYLWLFVALLDFYDNPMRVISGYEKYPIVHSLLPLCSCLNAIVYLVRSPEIKRYYKRKFFHFSSRKIRPTGRNESESNS